MWLRNIRHYIRRCEESDEVINQGDADKLRVNKRFDSRYLQMII